MPASYSIPYRIELLLFRAQRYMQFAEALHDHRTAAEVAVYEKELEVEAGRLEKWKESRRGQDRGRTTLAP